MNTSHASTPRPKITARFAGVMMLLTIAGGVFAQGYVSNRLVSFTDAALTANNILTNRSLFEIAYTVYLIEMACQMAFTALVYALLSPVNRSIAVVAAFVDLSATVMKTVSRAFFILPLFVLSGGPALSAFNSEQLRALALLVLKMNDRVAGMSLGFFGVSGLLFGYLTFRSTFLPRTLGVLSMLGSAGWLRWFFPALRYPSFTIVAVLALLVCAVKIFWLIVYGVDEEKWKALYASNHL